MFPERNHGALWLVAGSDFSCSSSNFEDRSLPSFDLASAAVLRRIQKINLSCPVHDPLLATLLLHAYGDGSWRYTHSMPRDWGGGPRYAVRSRATQAWHQHTCPRCSTVISTNLHHSRHQQNFHMCCMHTRSQGARARTCPTMSAT